MKPLELLQWVNETLQTSFVFVRKYASGEQGAFSIVDPDGRRCVLKWHPDLEHINQIQYTIAVTRHLRARGYPIPELLRSGFVAGGTFTIQTELPGTPMAAFQEEFLPRVFALNEMQLQQAPPGPREWPKEVVNTLLYGGQGYCQHEAMREYSPETAEMLYRLQKITLKYQDEDMEKNDIVHYDFHHLNMLVHDNEISGVIDWDGTCAGDASFDLVTLLFYSYGQSVVREQFWRYLLERTTLPVLSLYLAHMILRQVDWSLRYHDQAICDLYIARGHKILQELAHRARAS